MILVSGRPVKASNITFSQMGYGSANRAQSQNFEINLSKDEFVSKMDLSYRNCIVELKQDDAITGEFEFPYPGAYEYPQLTDFIDRNSENFFGFFSIYLKFDFLRTFFAEEDLRASLLVISLGGFMYDSNQIVISGKVGKLS